MTIWPHLILKFLHQNSELKSHLNLILGYKSTPTLLDSMQVRMEETLLEVHHQKRDEPQQQFTFK